MLLANYSNGQDVARELLLGVHVAAPCGLSHHGHHVFSSLGVLHSRATGEEVKAELPRQYGDAFKSDVIATLLEAALDTGGNVGGLSGRIGNYFKGAKARRGAKGAAANPLTANLLAETVGSTWRCPLLCAPPAASGTERAASIGSGGAA
jgi:hypothetical protein